MAHRHQTVVVRLFLLLIQTLKKKSVRFIINHMHHCRVMYILSSLLNALSFRIYGLLWNFLIYSCVAFLPTGQPIVRRRPISDTFQDGTSSTLVEETGFEQIGSIKLPPNLQPQHGVQTIGALGVIPTQNSTHGFTQLQQVAVSLPFRVLHRDSTVVDPRRVVPGN